MIATTWKGLWRLFVLFAPIIGLCIVTERWPWPPGVLILSVVLAFILFLAYLVGCNVEKNLSPSSKGKDKR